MSEPGRKFQGRCLVMFRLQAISQRQLYGFRAGMKSHSAGLFETASVTCDRLPL